MSRINLEDNKTYGLRLGSKTVLESGTIGAATILTKDSPPVQFITAAGAINVQLPPSDPANPLSAVKGQIICFANLAGGVTTVQSFGGAAFTTAISVAANAATRVICTGSATLGLGWVIW